MRSTTGSRTACRSYPQLHLQLPHAKSPEAADALRSAGARVMAIAAVHERLYTGSDVRVVSLDEFLESLCEEIGRALGCPKT